MGNGALGAGSWTPSATLKSFNFHDADQLDIEAFNRTGHPGTCSTPKVHGRRNSSYSNQSQTIRNILKMRWIESNSLVILLPPTYSGGFYAIQETPVPLAGWKFAANRGPDRQRGCGLTTC